MRLLQTLPFIGLAVATVHEPLARRQVDVVKGVFEKVQAGTEAVGAAAKAFTGDPGPLTQASNALLAQLKAGTDTISKAAEVDITGATQIAQYVTGLQGAVQNTIKATIAIKAQAAAVGQGGVIYDNLVQQRAASQALSDATTKKTPAALQSVAQQLSAGIISAIDEGIAAYKEFQGQTAPAAGGSTPASTPTTDNSAPVAPAASAPPTTGGASNFTLPPECFPPTPIVPPKPATTPTPTKAPPPTQFTGGAGSTNPFLGFALAAACLVAAL